MPVFTCSPACNCSILHCDILFCLPSFQKISPSLSGGAGLFEVNPYSLVGSNQSQVVKCDSYFESGRGVGIEAIEG